jgi:hypothetical protein
MPLFLLIPDAYGLSETQRVFVAAELAGREELTLRIFKMLQNAGCLSPPVVFVVHGTADWKLLFD